MFEILRIGKMGDQSIGDIYKMRDELNFNPEYQRVGKYGQMTRGNY